MLVGVLVGVVLGVTDGSIDLIAFGFSPTIDIDTLESLVSASYSSIKKNSSSSSTNLDASYG